MSAPLLHVRGAILLQLISLLLLTTLWISKSTIAADGTPSGRIPPSAASQTCTGAQCHDSLLTRKVMHGPVAQEKCLACHPYDDPAQHRFKRLAAPNQGCTGCHDMKPKTIVHGPVRDGRCTDCHDPHGSDFQHLLRADPATGLCQSCHKQEALVKGPLPHAPFAAGTCGACHEPHSAAQPRLLKQEPVALCTGCHPQALPRLGQALSIHVPAQSDCIACHEPHAAKSRGALKQSVPALCLSCHKNVGESMARLPVKHAAMTGDGACMNCHAPQFSTQAKLQKVAQPQECLACHDKELIAPDGHKIADMAALLKDNPEQHGPIRLGACTACHQPHGGAQAKLLIAAYPPEFYAPFDEERYKLCFTCHAAEIVLQSQNAPTGFADGVKNLHWLHVNQEKGRTCRACHEVHASKEPFHIRDAVPFGPNGWPMTIQFRQTPTGGSCTPGCHGTKTYDHCNRPRTMPVAALTPKATALLNPKEPATLPAMAGDRGRGVFPVPAPPFTPGIFPCTTCHDPNQAVNTRQRTLQRPHQEITLEHDQEHRWCLDCHNAQNRDVLRSASGEPIPFSESYRLCGQCHGLQFRDWKSGVHGKRTGEWDGRKEYLLCVNCHDPHSPKFKSLKPLPPPVRPDKAK